jgi:transposase
VFEKLIQVLRFGCSYAAIADCTCSATTIRVRRDEWIAAGIFARLKQIALDAYDRGARACAYALAAPLAPMVLLRPEIPRLRLARPAGRWRDDGYRRPP